MFVSRVPKQRAFHEFAQWARLTEK